MDGLPSWLLELLFLLSSAVQWWEDSQLRILVLSSLGVQCYLAFFAGSRKSHIRLLYRFSIWLAYIGGDAVAIYALATLFNRQKKLHYKTGSHGLEVLWAPVLLIHLGGQINISAFNIEDNELWRRHILTAVSQVTVALYVFCTSWPYSADKRLLAAAILLFILGLFGRDSPKRILTLPEAVPNRLSKCLEKPLALRRASFNRQVSSFPPAPKTKTTLREVELEAYEQAARHFHNEDPTSLDKNKKLAHLKLLSQTDKLFIDSAYAYEDHLTRLKSFWLLNDEACYKALYRGISKTFNTTYTRDSFYDGNRNGGYSMLVTVTTFFVSVILPIVPIALFHSSRKGAYRKSDIKVTFILLYITYFLEFASFVSVASTGSDWNEKVAQHSLIGFLSCNKRHTMLMGSLKPCHSCKSITNLVRSHVKDGWANYISDVKSYWKFTDMRGQWTLKRNGCDETLRGSLEKPFDESILLWHVATDFCFHCKSTSRNIASLCRDISNYMVHLLFDNPEMLMPGTRRSLFTDAYNELEAILQGKDISSLDEKEITKLIIDKVESTEGIIHEAWVLAQELMNLGDEKMWEVIKGVWIEMLCFSAGRCRGYLHIKSLGSGGEYLTFVSLLMSHAGLETFVARQQRVQLRLQKEVRLHIVKIRTMKKEIIEAVQKRKEKVDAAKEGVEEAAALEAGCASPKIEVVVSK
ncbi:hypothetical protein EJB05_09814, partial [Eragrostis curvula]